MQDDDDGIHPDARGPLKRTKGLLFLVLFLCLAIEAVGQAVGLWPAP